MLLRWVTLSMLFIYFRFNIFFRLNAHRSTKTAQREHHLFCIKLLGISELNACYKEHQHYNTEKRKEYMLEKYYEKQEHTENRVTRK